MRRRAVIFMLLCALSLPLTAVQARGEATVYSGGLIYTKAGEAPAQATVVDNGCFSYVGSLEGALLAAGEGCHRVDLEGRVMLPSFFEAHAHPDMGSLLDLRNFSYAGELPTPEEYVAHIRAYLEAHPNTQVLRARAGTAPSSPTRRRTKRYWIR